MAKILLVEDDPDLGSQMRQWLESERHVVERVHTGFDAEAFLQTYQYDVVILDWELPGKSGIDLCRGLRTAGDKTPVMFVTGKSDLRHKECGFNAGADDYLTKPFALAEVGFRIKALLRRSSGFQDSHCLSVRNIRLEPDKFRVTVDGRVVKLLPKEFALLEFFMRHPGDVFSAEALLNRIWPADSRTSAESVSVCLRRLRHKIETDPARPLIVTVHAVGYRLDP